MSTHRIRAGGRGREGLRPPAGAAGRGAKRGRGAALPSNRRGKRVSTWVYLLLAGCADGRPNEIVHPTRVNLPPEGGPVVRAERSPLGLSDNSLQEWFDMRNTLLRDPRTIVSLGRPGVGRDTADADVFGREMDIALDGARNIFVLDRLNHRVAHFSSRGEHLGDIGRAGSGPGEFQDPRTLSLLPDGRLIISDRGTRIVVFLPTDSGFVHSNTITTGILTEHACSVGDRVFVSGWNRGQIRVNKATGRVDQGASGADETIIHEIPMFEDRAPQSFGKGYRDDSWVVRSELSRGPIACVREPSRVVFAYDRIPVVSAYSAGSGTLLWAARLEDYLQPPLIEFAEIDGLGTHGRVGQDIVMSLTPVSPHHLALQTLRLPATRPGEEIEPDDTEIRTYLMDAGTGQGAFISASLPLIADASVDYYVAVWPLPYPRLEVRMWKPLLRGAKEMGDMYAGTPRQSVAGSGNEEDTPR